MKFNKILFIIFLSSFLGGGIFAQTESVQERREREHSAVKEFIQQQTAKIKKSEKTSENFVMKDNSAFSLKKTTGQADRKSYLMNGNRITVQVTNFGGIGPGLGLIRNVNNFVWNDLSYVFTFGPVVGAEVVNEKGDTIHIISDGLNDYLNYGLQETSPSRDTLWQWQPLPGYADPDQPNMASNPAPDNNGDGKPDSWPRSWYNDALGKYVWPGFLAQDGTNADAEVFWAMDDRDNLEFPYYPFPNDRKRKGLGLQVDGRAFQWSNALAENTIFFVYTITNVSNKRLDKVFYGLYGDPDLGGGTPENSDDVGLFIPPYSLDSVDVSKIPVYSRSMVYLFDKDKKGDYGLPLGYLGCKFLESPGRTTKLDGSKDNFDDDGDGMIDESQEDGIDNDGDWNVDLHDVGIDGIPNTGDLGEGDGIPTAGLAQADGSPDPLYPGEPNFEFTDLDESDQIGLTSFNSWTWNSGGSVADDELMWNRAIPNNFSDVASYTDLVFVFGSGYISLDPGETKRISMALLVGEDLDDLLVTAEVVQTIYNQNYQFYKPPVTPTVVAVPGDKKVTLFWDTAAEESIDPITGKDFEGYVIYRSTDPKFGDIKIITDGKGSSFLNEPLKDVDGFEAKFDVDLRDEPFTDLNGNGRYDVGEPFTDWNVDLKWTAKVEDPWQGYHPVSYQRRGVQYYLGDNKGLVHSYVDSNNVINGQTYYYAVVAYDHGDSVGIPVTETTKKITVDPITSKLTFDKNTVQVIPGPRASGYIAPVIDKSKQVEHVAGIGTGNIKFDIMNDLAIVNGGQYEIVVEDSMTVNRQRVAVKNYSVLNINPVVETFKLYDNKFTMLQKEGLWNDEFLKITNTDGSGNYVEDVDYIVDFVRGAVRRTDNSSMPNLSEFKITYRFRPVIESTAFSGEDVNPVFDGVRLKVYDEAEIKIDSANTRWIEGKTNYTVKVALNKSGLPKKAKYPADYQIRFSSQPIDSAVMTDGKKRPVNYSVSEVTYGVPTRILTFLSETVASTRNFQWDPGEEIVLFKPGAKGLPTETVTWGVLITKPADTLVVPMKPSDGDVLQIATKRPFDSKDIFKLTTVGASLDNSLAKSKLDNIYVVPNPYVGYNIIEPTNKLPGQTRGERRIYFENLPSLCTIRIFTLSGDPVKKIDHDSGLENGREFWNLLNEDGFSVAYGVYIAHIDAPGIGEKILKFALIK
ncbi:MAG: hypothetical protein KKB34_12075 [Bacteroidetes bacterium]|nr:hypothetical protein [Bacteroidota bacterium]